MTAFEVYCIALGVAIVAGGTVRLMDFFGVRSKVELHEGDKVWLRHKDRLQRAVVVHPGQRRSWFVNDPEGIVNALAAALSAGPVYRHPNRRVVRVVERAEEES